MSPLLPLLLILLLLVLAAISFFFSLSETSIIGLSKIKLRHMLSRNVKHSHKVQKLITNSDKFIVGLLVGNNFVNISFSVIVSAIMVHILGERWGVIAATFATTAFVLTFCEILPKIIALKSTERMAVFVAPIMDAYTGFVHPVAKFFTSLSDIMLSILGIEHQKRTALVTEEELRLMIEVGKEEGVLTDEAKKMMHRIFEFGDLKAKDVMVPKDKIVAVSISATPEELLNIFAEQGHSRLPVYKGSVENVIGVIYARDLLYILRDRGLFVLADLVHSAYYALTETRVSELLRKFQTDKIQMAIVVDQDRKTQGVVTLEDLVEEIVGEIEEQYPANGHK